MDDAEVDESTQVSWKNKRAFCVFFNYRSLPFQDTPFEQTWLKNASSNTPKLHNVRHPTVLVT